MVRGLSQSVPTPKTSELARVVVIDAVGSPATPAALLAMAVAAPASEFAAPVKPTTVIDAVAENLIAAVAVIDACAVGAKAYHTSAVPACALACAARVHVSAGKLALLFMLLTFCREPAGVAGVVDGPSAEMNATSSVFAATANAGLVMVVFGLVEFRETNVAMVGAVPVETTSATALPAAALEPPVGVWLMTTPAATVGLGCVVIAPTTRPAPVSDVVAAVCV